jgi:hypothetical protein
MGSFNPTHLIDSLERTPVWLPAMVGPLADGDLRWKPADGGWSIAEIVGHLADEERLDFRPRLISTLIDPATPWPPIDPEGRVAAQRWNDRPVAEPLDEFLRERRASLEWLHRPADHDWTRAYDHPRVGPIRAGDLLAAWAAHDALHLRQIAKRLFQMTQRDAADYSTAYAGEWKA